MCRLITEGLRTVCGGPFSFSVGCGECVALSGPSGCGKTLLLRALADLDPAEGTVLLGGESRDQVTAPQWRRRVGWLPAESAWWYDRVGDHFPIHECHILEALGFDKDVLDWRVDRLSTGEKQRLALFRLLANEPEVLLLDEPTAALDRMNVCSVETVIADYRRSAEAAVLWVSHDPDQVERVASRHLQFTQNGLEAVQ